MDRIRAGQVIGRTTLAGMDAAPVPVPDASGLVHLQFRRFAGCPFCSLHLRSFARRHHEIRAANLREVAVFRSAVAASRRHHAEDPWSVDELLAHAAG